MTLGTGVKTDIRTGAPIQDNPRVRKEELEARLQEAVSRSLAFQADLNGPGGLVLDAMVEQMIVYAGEVLSEDRAYKNFLATLQRMNIEIEIAPRIVERHLKMVLPSYDRSRPERDTGEREK
jgi:hypothetical protein